MSNMTVVDLFLQLPDKHGITPLLAAIYEDHMECVKLLLAKVNLAIWFQFTVIW